MAILFVESFDEWHQLQIFWYQSFHIRLTHLYVLVKVVGEPCESCTDREDVIVVDYTCIEDVLQLTEKCFEFPLDDETNDAYLKCNGQIDSAG